MSGKRKENLNSLNVSLHSVISGDAVNESNIPFADDEDVKNENTNRKSSTSSNESFEKVKYSRGRRPQATFAIVDSDREDSEAEGRDKPGPLISELLQGAAETSNLGSMRRNSISMPVLNENQLDLLRNLHLQAKAQAELSDSKESLDEVRKTAAAAAGHVFRNRKSYRTDTRDSIVLFIYVVFCQMTTLTSFDKKIPCLVTSIPLKLLCK